MKIACIAYLHGFGGAEKQIIMLANEMVERGHEVTLISLSDNKLSYTLNDEVTFIYLKDKYKDVRRLIYRYYLLRKTLKKLSADIVVNFWFQAAYLTAFMRKEVIGKTIYAERGDPGDSEYKGILGFIRKIAFPLINGFVFQSNAAKSYFNKGIQKRSIVIPNAVFINGNKFPKIEKRKKNIVAVARLHEQKNLDVLIDAFCGVKDIIPLYRLEIYGEGELKEHLQEKIKKLHLVDRILLKGTSKNIHKEIYNAGLFVLSSNYEGMPNALLEAMTLGIPCISTDWKPGGACEIIKNNIDGLVVPINSEEELRKAILKMTLNQDFSRRCSENSYKKMKSYVPDKIYKIWETYLAMLTNS